MESDDTPAAPPDENANRDEAAVRRELARIKRFAKELTLEDLRRGDWFTKLLRFALHNYVQKVNAEYFSTKYPGMPADAVVKKRTELAAQHASIAGGLNSLAYNGAIAATIGSRGGASPLTVPAAGATLVVDMLYVTQLQLHLAYDIAVLYRVPLDLSDPEDLWKLIRVANRVRAGEVGGSFVQKGLPGVVRPLVKKVFSGNTLAVVQKLPLVGQHILQRHIIKFAIPAVGIPAAVAWNYRSTKAVGAHARKIFREEARIAEAARRIAERTDHHAELLWVLWLIINSDGQLHHNELLLQDRVTAIVREQNSDLPALADLQSTIDLDREMVWSMLASAAGDLGPLYDAGVVAAAVDGNIADAELEDMRKLAKYCSVPFDEDAIREAAKKSA